MSLLDRLADAHIEAALERGEFDDLPGAGRPQQLDDDTHVPAELKAGYRLLKNAGFVPPEIQTRRDIRNVEDLLASAQPRSARAQRLRRRLRWLETRLAESQRGRELLIDEGYRDRIRQRLGHGDGQ